MRKKYVVRLTPAERAQLTTLVSTGTAAAYRIKHANILLTADVDGPAWRDGRIAEAFGCHERTVENVRRRCVLEGLEAAVARKKQVRPSRRPILDGAGEAQLIAVACSAPPAGRARWTLHLLADALVRLEVVEAISVPTVRRALKKTRCSPTARPTGSFRPSTMPRSSRAWRTCWRCTSGRMIRRGRWSAWTSGPYNW